jgi:hypothetical protein
MFDIYYNGQKPNLFPHELPATSLLDARAKSRTKFFWFVDGQYDMRQFNFNWVPPPWEEHQTHIFLKYSQFEQFQITFAPKDVTQEVEHYYDREFLPRHQILENWKILKTETTWIINTDWVPNPFSPPYIYVFGNPWYSAVDMPTAEYHVPGATEYYYCDEPVLTLTADKECWKTLIDYIDATPLSTWAPNPFDPPFIYVFGNQWYPAEEMPTVEYCVPGAIERKYVDDVRVTLLPLKERWFIPEEVNESIVDFSWVPHPKDTLFIYHFGTEFQQSVGLTYTVPGATELKFVEEFPTINHANAVQVLSMFFVDMNNKSANTRYAALQATYPNIQKIRFINGWIETIKRCSTRSKTSKFWVVSSENIYTNFNFEWHAQPWQNFMTHVFGSQWQKWSDTFLINKIEFERHAKWAKTIEEFPNLNFVKDQPVYRPDDLHDIYYVDHFDSNSPTEYEKILLRYPNIKSLRFVDNYLDTLKRIISTADTEYIWVINSICDYSKFDFTWQPEPWQAKMLHVFPSNEQKFGDTFYIHVPTFKEQMDKIELLDWFDTVNYCSDQIVPRAQLSITPYSSDSVVDAIKSHIFTAPYAVLQHISVNSSKIPVFTPSIWRKKDRAVHVLSQSGSLVLVPRDAKSVIETQIYDYPHIMPHKELYIKDRDLDIVYLSNGEPDAEKWYNHLVTSAPNQNIHWVKNVKGRANAYKECARVSTTLWFFNVFAKMEVDPKFDWSWQPDYLQQPKHYIFNIKNPVNGLEYGHMACIAYNKKLVLETEDYGLDFTLSKEHEVVPITNGVAHFNVNPIITWRSAFRECIKLRDAKDEVSKQRLEIWRTVATGNYGEWSIAGANDAVEYYDSVSGEYSKLMLTFEWEWLDAYYKQKYQS